MPLNGTSSNNDPNVNAKNNEEKEKYDQRLGQDILLIKS